MDYETAGMLLYWTHMLMLLSVFVWAIYFPKIMLFVFAPVYVYHMMFSGCPLTRIERSLHRKDITVLDPIIEGFGYQANRKTRKLTHIVASTILMIFVVYNSMTSTW